MRVYKAIAKGLEFVGVDAVFGGAGENSANLLALKHSTKIKPVVVGQVADDVLRQHSPISIGLGAISINDDSAIAPPLRTNRNLATFVQPVYPLVNIFAMFLAWGAFHA
jgi:hypothetical protein